MIDRTSRLTLFLAAASILVTLGKGQCSAPSWTAANALPGINGPVNASISWDPDGPGPAAPMLVCGGYFLIAGSQPVQHLASWNGTAWQSLGGGVDGQVNALGVYNGELIVGGQFTTAGSTPASNVVRWNGATWHPLGSGTDGKVAAFGVYNGELIAAGAFGTAGGNPASRIARWNGATWQPLGAGLDVEAAALAVYQGNLVAGGYFQYAGGWQANRIAQWNGSAWTPLGSGLTSISAAFVKTLEVYGGSLVVGGSFHTAGGVAARNVAAWNGTSWQAVGTGSDSPTPYNTSVVSLVLRAGELIAGGSFTTIGGTLATRVARWNGSTWQPLGAGVGDTTKSSLATMTLFNGDLIACGVYGGAGGVAARNVARWDGTAWHALTVGIDGAVLALEPYAGGLVVGGQFAVPGGNPASNDVVWWDGSTFHALGSGGFDATIYAFTTYNGALIAGGKFSVADGGTPALGVSQWSGSAWGPVGAGLAGAVMTFGSYGGELIAGGFLPGIGIARFDGTNWQTLGGGTNGNVNAVAIYNGELVAAGRFTTAGGVAANAIARWDGSTWQPLGSGVTSSLGALTSIYDLAIYNGELVAGGNFTSAGGVTANKVARWNGSTWQPVGASFARFDVLSLKVRGSDLIAGGSFSSGTGFDHVARWDGTSWQPLGLGIDGNVWALSELDGSLIAGGDFGTAGGLASPYLARWSSPQPRLMFSQPQSGSVQVEDCWLIPGHEYYNIVSLDLAPAGVGTGPWGGLWFNDPSVLWQQVALPLGTAPFHFVAPGAEFTFGPYPLPPGLAFEAISVDVTGGVIGCLAPAQRHTMY